MVDMFFSTYDRWQGAIPLIGGVYVTLAANGVVRRKTKDTEQFARWQKKFGPMARVMGPMLVTWGFIQLVMNWAK